MRKMDPSDALLKNKKDINNTPIKSRGKAIAPVNKNKENQVQNNSVLSDQEKKFPLLKEARAKKKFHHVEVPCANHANRKSEFRIVIDED